MPVSPLTSAPVSGATMSPALVVLLLGLLLGLQPLATDLYLPALPALQTGLSAPVAQVQLTLTALLLAFGCSQLLWGPLSDRWGRRPVLLTGLAGYVIGALGCAAVDSMGALIGWRALQGAALGACVMCARAVVRDLYGPVQGAQAMSRALSGLGMIAFLAPVSGSLLVELLGWRSTMVAQALLGAVVLLFAVLRFQESLPQRNPQALQPLALARNWARIVRHPTFQAYNLLTIFSYAGLFTNLAASSFTYIEVLGMERSHYGLMMGANALFYIGGTVLCRRMLRRWSVQRCVAWAGLASALGGLAMLASALAGLQSVWAYALPFMLFQLAHGVHMPCGQSNAISPFPQSAGTASAVNGFGMMLVAFAMGHWLGLRLDGSTMALSAGVAFWGACTALTAWLLVRRFGQTSHL